MAKATLARWFVVLPTALTIACGGRACGEVSTSNISQAVAGASNVSQTVASSKSNHGPAGESIQPDQVNGILQGLEAVREHVPRVEFDLQAVIDQVGEEPANLLAWVRTRTTWVPYRGALKGARGVLMDRMGNSVDRALLLASLLANSGHRARLARGSLSTAQARELLEKTRAGVSPPLATQPAGPSTADLVQQYARAFQVDAAQLGSQVEFLTQQAKQRRAELGRRAASQAAFLEQRVRAVANATAEFEEAVACATDRWWVQVADGDRWQDLDPDPVRGITAAQVFDFDPSRPIPLPREHAQELTLRVIVEQWSNGRAAERTALEHTLRPAEVMDQPITISHVPLKWPKPASIVAASNRPATLKEAALRQTEWLPVLTVGKQVIRQSSFLNTGELNSKPGSSSGLRDATQDVLGGGLDALGGGEAVPAPGELTAEWIEYEVRVPGSAPLIVRRDVFDLFDQLPSAARTSPPAIDDNVRLGRAMSLIGAITVLPQVSRIPLGYVALRTREEVIEELKVVPQMTASMTSGDLAGAVAQVDRLPISTQVLLNLGALRFEWSPVQSNVFIAAPNILTHRRTVGLTEAGLAFPSGFDIVINSVATHPTARGSGFSARLMQGVVDTNLEALVQGDSALGNAGTLMASSGQSQDAWLTIRATADLPPPNAPFSRPILGRIANALREGRVVVAPPSNTGIGTDGRLGWWEIDPQTGDTLGIGADGWGQALIEYIEEGAIPAIVAFHYAGGLCLWGTPGSSKMSVGQVFSTCLSLTSAGGPLVLVALFVYQIQTNQFGPPSGGSGS